jgi:hypothetical protein
MDSSRNFWFIRVTSLGSILLIDVRGPKIFTQGLEFFCRIHMYLTPSSLSVVSLKPFSFERKKFSETVLLTLWLRRAVGH